MSIKSKVEVEIPEKVSASYSDKYLTVKGEKGEITKKMFFPGIKITVGDKIEISLGKTSRKFKKVANTYISHIKNMVQGVQEPYVAKLKIVYLHFPMTVKQEGDLIKITNFVGENHPRIAKVLPNVEVEIKGKDITLTGIDIENVGQTAANIEQATKISSRDRRRFQDGIFITKKPKSD